MSKLPLRLNLLRSGSVGSPLARYGLVVFGSIFLWVVGLPPVPVASFHVGEFAAVPSPES